MSYAKVFLFVKELLPFQGYFVDIKFEAYYVTNT